MTQHLITNGSELISQAAIDAGVNFFAGYPITPASSVYSAMLNKLQAEGKVALGVSDEISGIAMCIGAAMRGAKSMTATAAPGLSLMIESIGYAFATETPMLIVLGQRLGPSTGAATQSAEGDISFIQTLVSGGFTIPVIAPNSIFNCYEMTIKAINVSEMLRTPVILLTEKDIIMSTVNVDYQKLQAVKESQAILQRPYHNFESTKPYKTYDFNQLSEVPEFVAAGVGGEDRVVATASTHDKAGNLSKTSKEALEVIQHLKDKTEKNLDKYSFHEFSKYSESPDYDKTKNHKQTKSITVISFLQTDLSAREAVIKARQQGIKVNHLTLYTLFPVLESVITNAIEDAELIVIPEINISGQYADIIKHLFFNKENKKIEHIKINSIAKLISPKDILKVLEGHK